MSSDVAVVVVLSALVVLAEVQCRAHRRSLRVPPAAPLSHVRKVPR